MPRFRRVLLSTTLAIAACRHGDSFQIVDQGTDQPRVAGSPTRLTYNPLPDTEPAWLPGDSLLLYTAFRADHDSVGCIELLPGTGGQAIRSVCEPTPAGNDSMFADEAGAVSPTGNLAYLRVAKGPPHPLWTEQVLMVRPLDGSRPARVITPLPAIGLVPPHTSASHIAWLDAHRFVYRADQYLSKFHCPNCQPPYDASVGLFVNVVDISTEPATITTVPGTDSAIGLAVQDSDDILVSVGGSINRIVLSTGASSIFWNGGAADFQAAGNRLVLTSGGLTMIDVISGATTILDTNTDWSNLALTRDGKHLVAQRARDLWLFNLP